MNIFVLSLDPAECASMHADQHVGKMYLEAVQLLCGAYSEPFEEESFLHTAWKSQDPLTRLAHGFLPYAHTHAAHPCQKWVKVSLANYKWLLELAACLGNEFADRFGRRHGTDPAFRWCSSHTPECQQQPDHTWFGRLRDWHETHRTPFAQAMPEQYRGPDPVQAYRDYYRAEKRILRGKPATWTKRPVPEWFRGEI